MSDLTAEERDFLIDYSMKPENICFALAIGHIQVQLREKILSSFLEKLDESVREKLEACGRRWQWETMALEMNLKLQGNRTGLKVQGSEEIYVMTMKDQEIKIYLSYDGEDIFVGTPAANEACPQAEDLSGFFEDTGLSLNSNNYWRWWFYPKERHKPFDDLYTLHDDELKRKKIAYFTDILVLSAKAISKKLEE